MQLHQHKNMLLKYLHQVHYLQINQGGLLKHIHFICKCVQHFSNKIH